MFCSFIRIAVKRVATGKKGLFYNNYILNDKQGKMQFVYIVTTVYLNSFSE